MTMGEVLAFQSWPTNGHLIADVVKLGYITPTDRVLDCTYGLGNFWSEYQHPADLFTGCDLNPDKSPLGRSVDFTKMPRMWAGRYDVVVFDPPYKLNGTPDPWLDERYGVEQPTRWQDRMSLIRRGVEECARVVCVGGLVMVKCQDQVSSGAVRWQRFDVHDAAETWGMRLIDMFDMLGGRPQPAGRKQVHARRNSSTLMIFRRYQ
jgi:hypothetical protein